MERRVLLAEAEAFPVDGSHKWLTAAVLPCALQKLHLRKCLKWFRPDLIAESRQQMALRCSAVGGSTNGNHSPQQSHQLGSLASQALDSFISHYVHSCWKLWPALCEGSLKSPSLALFPWAWPRRSQTISIVVVAQAVECSLPLIPRSTCICPDCGCLAVLWQPSSVWRRGASCWPGTHPELSSSQLMSMEEY